MSQHEVRVQRLPSGYWRAELVGYHHAYAQWPVGRECTEADVSIGEQQSPALTRAVVRAARLAVAALGGEVER